MKYEQFKFVTDRQHSEFKNLRYYFSFMKECYLYINNIDPITNELDITKILLDQNLNILGDKFRHEMLLHFQGEKNKLPFEQQAGINEFELK